jgi:hypothetical protein
MKAVLTVIFCALFAPTGASAQDVQVKARLDTGRILIGDQINLWLQLEQKEGLKVNFPLHEDSLAGKIEVMSASTPDTISKANRSWKLRQRLVLTSFDTGFYVIPPLTFRYNNGKDSVRTEPLSLEVLGMPVDTTKGITDIKMPYELKITFAEVLPYIIVGLLLLAIVLFYLRYLRRKKVVPEVPQAPPAPLIPPHLIALEQLDELIREKLWQQGKIKLYYSRLTDILRQYIESRFKVPAMEQTTEDIIRDLKRGNHVRDEIRDELQGLLQLADLVKFAKWNPVAEENEASQQSAYDFVLRTKPVVNLRKPVENVEETDQKEGES